MAKQEPDPSAAFRQIQDPDPAIRLQGIKWIEKQPRHQHPGYAPWLEDPELITRLLPLLHDEDPQILENTLGAMYHIGDRFRLDPRLQAAAEPFLQHERPGTRMRATWILTLFDNPEAVEAVMTMFEDKDKKVRSLALGEIARHSEHWSPELIERIREAGLKGFDDRAMDVKCAAGKLFITVGRAEDIKLMKSKLASVKGTGFRQDFRESIQMLERRLAERQS